MNLIGLTMHKGIIGSGSVVSVEGRTLVPDGKGAELLGRLRAGTTYILEITSGTQEGSIQEITDWGDEGISTPDDLAKAGVQAGDKWSLRKAATLNSVIDPRLPGLKLTTLEEEGDVVFVPSGSSFGEFKRHVLVRIDDWTGWIDRESARPSGNAPLVYPDGLIVLRKGAETVNLPMVGEIKTGPTSTVVRKGLNLVAVPGPTAGCLREVGLENDLLRADSEQEADTVWVSRGDGMGVFARYWINREGKWMEGAGKEAKGRVPVGSAVLIERKGGTTSFRLGD